MIIDIDKVEEQKLLIEFRELVEELNQDENTLKRFLRARNHDLPAASDMLRKSLEWRRLNKVDEALTWAPDLDILKAFPVEYPGVDRRNQAIMYVPGGFWPVREMFEKGYGDRMRQQVFVYMEQVMEQVAKTEEQFTLIMDLEGMTYWNFGRYEIVQMGMKILRDFEANYPERMYEALMIYSPAVFHYLWPIIKTLLTGTTIGKIKFLGSNCSRFLPQVLERIPPSSLPRKYRRLMELHGIPDLDVSLET